MGHGVPDDHRDRTGVPVAASRWGTRSCGAGISPTLLLCGAPTKNRPDRAGAPQILVTKNDFLFSPSYPIIRPNGIGRGIAPGPRWTARHWSARSARKWGMAGGA